MYGKLYLVDRLLVYVQYFSIRYLMCAVRKKFAGMPRYLSASTANITPFAHTDKAQLTSDYE